MLRERAQFFRNTALFGAVFLVAADRLLKVIAEKFWQTNPIDIIANIFSLTFSKNTGIAFSLHTKLDPIYFIIPIIILVAILGARSFKQGRRSDAIAFFCVFLGAASNLYDRIAYGFVLDYLRLSYFSVFNLADVMITGGVIWLIIRELRKK